MIQNAMAQLALLASISINPMVSVESDLHVMVLGDSITVGCTTTPPTGWCGPLSTMLTASGIQHTITGHAVSGVDCGYWAQRIDAILPTDQPDVVLINCGTNNDGNSPLGRERLGEQYRTILEAIHVHNPTTKAAVGLIGYSNFEIQNAQGRAWLRTSEPAVNDTIYYNVIRYYLPAGWPIVFADFQRMPGTSDYLNGGSDGIHPNSALGHKTMAAIWYRSLVAPLGLMDNVPEPCGMWGHRPTYQEPEFISCTITAGSGG